MKHSSRHNPCPICCRNVDDKCRWTENAIFCFYGDSFHPPNSLQLGDVATAFGVEWRLVKLQGGFSGGSYVFLKARDQIEFRKFSDEERTKYNLETQRIKDKINKRFVALRKDVKSCFAIRDTHSMRTDELRSAINLLKSTLDECKNLYQFVYENKHRANFSAMKTAALVIWGKRVKYQRRDVEDFTRNYLMR